MSKSQLVLDKFSIGISAVCTVHCLAMPLIVGFMPALASMGFTHEHFHEALLYLILPTSSIALYLGCKKHKSKRVSSIRHRRCIHVIDSPWIRPRFREFREVYYYGRISSYGYEPLNKSKESVTDKMSSFLKEPVGKYIEGFHDDLVGYIELKSSDTNFKLVTNTMLNDYVSKIGTKSLDNATTSISSAKLVDSLIQNLIVDGVHVAVIMDEYELDHYNSGRFGSFNPSSFSISKSLQIRASFIMYYKDGKFNFLKYRHQGLRGILEKYIIEENNSLIERDILSGKIPKEDIPLLLNGPSRKFCIDYLSK